MRLVFMEIGSSMDLQSQGGHVVKGALLPDKPGYLLFLPLPRFCPMNSRPQLLVFPCFCRSDFLTNPYIENIWKCFY